MGAIRIEDLPNYTYEDYKEWEGRWELINGIAYAMSPSPFYSHQEISGKIHIELYKKMKECDKCKAVFALDWKIDNYTVVCPDNVVICSISGLSDFIVKPPSIIFEILSVATKKKDRTIKYEIYQREGVEYYVMIDPLGSLAEIYKLMNNGNYKLIGEYKKEKYLFKLKECEIDFDFRTIFE